MTDKRLTLIYRHNHRDYRGVVSGGIKTILVLREGGTQAVSLNDLAEAEISDRLRSAIKDEARRLGRQAHKNGIQAAPRLDAKCMTLVADSRSRSGSG